MQGSQNAQVGPTPDLVALASRFGGGAVARLAAAKVWPPRCLAWPAHASPAEARLPPPLPGAAGCLLPSRCPHRRPATGLTTITLAPCPPHAGAAEPAGRKRRVQRGARQLRGLRGSSTRGAQAGGRRPCSRTGRRRAPAVGPAQLSRRSWERSTGAARPPPAAACTRRTAPSSGQRQRRQQSEPQCHRLQRRVGRGPARGELQRCISGQQQGQQPLWQRRWRRHQRA